MRSLAGVTVFAAIAGFAGAAAADVYNQSWGGTAIKGYDTVAYFTQGQPVEGDSAYVVEWEGAEWRFASAENKALFETDPEKYAPQYGGYCAWAVGAKNTTADIDPDAWSIVDGKLYLNYSDSIQTRWEADISGFIQSADVNWPAIRADLAD